MITTKSVAILLLTSSACLFLSVGCDTSVKNKDVSSSAYDMQSVRSEVIEEFFSNPEESVPKYRAQWSRGFGDSEIDVARKIASAGQLMRRDKSNYERYYTYAKGALSSGSPQIQSLAVAALANAHGEESLDLIIDRIYDQNASIAAEAVSAIEYRYDSASAESGLESEERSIREKSERFCSSEIRAKRNQLKSFCDRLEK